MNRKNSIAPLDTSSLSEKVYERLLTTIGRQEFPTGLSLDVDKLAEKFGVSRTPIQSALARLAEIGLVEIRPRRGTFVTHLGKKDVNEIFELRAVIESYAVKKGATSATASELGALKEFIEKLDRFCVGDQYKDYHEFLKWDRQLHSMIAGLSKNRRLVAIHSQARTLLELTRAAANEHVAGANLSRQRHREILNALMKRDGEKAAEAVKKHSQESEQIVLNRLPLLEQGKSSAATKR